ncbi:MAG: hypothetical protein MH137_10965 [Flavobacteriales bacterium]|nr:hypothetical protein [Flavobacteriales bacterium]
MKKTAFWMIAGIMAVSSVWVSCKKNNSGACEGNTNLCFTLNGQEISVNAGRMELPNNRYRLYWEETNQGTYKNIEIDIYGNVTGEYTFAPNAGTSGEAAFQYFVNSGGTATNYVGQSGTLNLTSASSGWSGTFSGTVNDGTTDFTLTNGVFSDVPLE